APTSARSCPSERGRTWYRARPYRTPRRRTATGPPASSPAGRTRRSSRDRTTPASRAAPPPSRAPLAVERPPEPVARGTRPPEAVRDRRVAARERTVGDHGAHVGALPGERERDRAPERLAEERHALAPRLRPRAEPVERGARVAQLPVAERRGLAIERARRAEI